MIRVLRNSKNVAVRVLHKPDVKLTKEPLSNIEELINYFRLNIKRIIIDHHQGDLNNKIIIFFLNYFGFNKLINQFYSQSKTFRL